MIPISDLKPGMKVVVGYSIGYDACVVLKGLHDHPDYPWPVVEVEIATIPGCSYTMCFGGAPGYEPTFYPLDI